MSKVATIPAAAVPDTTATAAAEGMITLIERIIRDPSIEVSRVERMLDVYERMVAARAEASFNAAFAEMQPRLPVIARHGRIEIRAKGARGERDGAVIQSTQYAKWEDINEAIKPHLRKYGFALTFKNGLSDDGRIIVIGELRHRDGHKETTQFILPHDSTGSKNAVQAIGSSTSYGQRYAATSLLNLTSRNEDDDGQAGGAAAVISDDQAQTIRTRLRDTNADFTAFLDHMAIAVIEDLPAARYDEAIGVIKSREDALKARGQL
jgi:hypothetical protein